MNGGDNYSSRDSGRHGSSRDHYSARGGGDREDRRERDRGGDRDGHRRRRSRSPRHSRRDYEADTYQSSRDYREREREERYAGRDRREERGGWERDRGGRDRRRDEEERPRRDRDLMNERGGRGRRDREDHSARQEKKKSASPPPKKKEPTPDLTDIVSVLDRKRRMTQWDIKPPGYENITAEQAKLSGMFPLPGAPRQQQMDPSRLQAFMNNSAGSASATALKTTQARQSKRLLVANIPGNATNDSITDFFNVQLNGLNVITGVDPCISSQIASDRAFALLEFKSPQDATMALALDGITMEDNDNMETSNGTSNGDTSGLKISRPKDYIVPTTTSSDENHQEGVVSNIVEDSQNKLCISNIPVYLTDEQVTELLVTFGQLKAFVLVKDTSTEQSRGIAFSEYIEPTATDEAIEGLNDMELGGLNLKIKRASVGLQQAAGLESGVNAIGMLAGTTASSTEVEQGRVIQLLNMVTPEELMDNEEYQEICDDVKEESSKYGRILDIKVPRPTGGRQNPGVGKIFVKYEDAASAQKALQALAGRKFADRTVVVTHFAEEYFDINAW